MKMTAKKRWLNKIYHDSQELSGSTQGNISWSSSESSDDEFVESIHKRKKKKVIRTTDVSNSWIKSNGLQEREKISKRNRFKEKAMKMIPSVSNCFSPQFPTDSKSAVMQSPWELDENPNNCDLTSGHSEILQLPLEVEKNPYHCDFIKKHCSIDAIDEEVDVLTSQFSESPIINHIKLEELSPVLSSNLDDIDQASNVSPVLGKILDKRALLERVRSKYKKKYKDTQEINKSFAESPDLFPSQPTQIIEYDSPQFYKERNLTLTTCNASPSTECIDPFPSQCSSQIINSDTDSSLGKTDNSSLYHQPVPRKRNFKKGGLASLVQKALHLQKTRTAIWHHEMYTKKADTVMRAGEDIIEFTIKKEWKEYGSTLLECEATDNKLCSKSQKICLKNSENRCNFFIIVIGFSVPLKISYKIDCKYKLFPPYSIKDVKYKSGDTPCYFNVTKIILSEEEDIMT